MLNLQEIRNYYFEKAGSNRYRAEDVDNFKTQAIEFIEKLIRDNNEMARKLSAASSKLEEFKEQEDSIRSALLNAQRLGDSIIRESKAKAETIINQSNEHAQQIINEAQNRSDDMLDEARESIVNEQKTLDKLKEEVSQFRGKLLTIYKEHIELITTLPTVKEEEPAESIQEPETEEIQEEAAEQETKPEPKPDVETQNKFKKPKFDLSYFGDHSKEPEDNGFKPGRVIR